MLAHLDVGVADAGRVENELRNHGLDVTGTDYGVTGRHADAARLHLALDPAHVEAATAQVAAATSGGTALVVTDHLEWVDA